MVAKIARSLIERSKAFEPNASRFLSTQIQGLLAKQNESILKFPFVGLAGGRNKSSAEEEQLQAGHLVPEVPPGWRRWGPHFRPTRPARTDFIDVSDLTECLIQSSLFDLVSHQGADPIE